MVKKITTAAKTLEREYVIPLREKSRNVPRYRKTEKATKTVKEFIARHMKVVDRDLKKVRIDSYLNESIWINGIKRHPHKIKVRAVKEDDIVRVYAVDLPEKLKFKKERAERVDKKAKEGAAKKKKKTEEEKPKTEEENKEEAERKDEEKEKKAAVVETGKEIEKAAAKQIKQQKQPAFRQPKHVHRKALQK